MEQFNLNTIPGKVAPVCNSSQYDTGRKIRVYLFEGSQVYTLDGTEVLSVSVRKPDGHIVTEGVTNTGAEYVEIVTTEQMTACAGDNLCELKIEKGGDVIGTLNFILRVELDPLAGGDPSESFVYNLQTQIAAAVSDQYDSNAVIFDGAPTAGHGVGYAVTSEGVKNANDALAALIPTDLDDLDDVTTTAPAQGEALVWDGTKWVNGTVSTVGSIDDLSDVDTTGKATGDSLRYNGLEWVAKPTTVKMTQAEYNAIVDFTPYENTHIVITDAPNLNATASDIEYSSGVSVKQAIDSKQDSLSNQAITLTPNTSVLGSSGFTGACYQYGKVVCLFVQTASPISEVAYESIFLSGLPKPVYASSNNRVSLTDRATNKPYRFRITDSGQLQEWYNSNGKIPNGADLYGTIVYLAE